MRFFWGRRVADEPQSKLLKCLERDYISDCYRGYERLLRGILGSLDYDTHAEALSFQKLSVLKTPPQRQLHCAEGGTHSFLWRNPCHGAP